MVDNADYRVNATDGAVRPTPLTDKKNREKKGPSRKKKHTTPKANADRNTDPASENTETKTDSDHLVDYYA